MMTNTFLAICTVAMVYGLSLVRAGESMPKKLSYQESLNNWFYIVTADQNYYHLAAADLLNASEVPINLLEDTRDSNGNFQKSTFKFDSSESLRKGAGIRTRINFQDQLAFHVYDDKEDILRARGPQVNQEFCGLHLDYMLHMIDRFKANKLMATTELSIWHIMQSYDAPIMGLTHGNNIFPGDYARCKEMNLNVIKRELVRVNETAANKFFSTEQEDENSFFNSLWAYMKPFLGSEHNWYTISLSKFSDKIRALPMRYCLAGLRWPNWPNSTFYRRNFVLRTAACLPETCDSSSLELYHDKIKLLTEFQMPNHALGYYIQELYCLPDEKSELRDPLNYTSTILLILFNIVWLALIITATLVRFRGHTKCRDSNTWSSYLNCWCLTDNWNKFLCTRRDIKEEKNRVRLPIESDDEPKAGRNTIDLAPLEGWKFFGQFFIVCAHVSATGLNFTRNSDQTKKLLGSDWPSGWMFLAQSTVNSFFVITAIISVRLILRNTPRKMLFKPKFWIVFIFYRYLRIVPYYLLVQWFWKAAFRFTGSGPYWDYGTSFTGKEKIRQLESWWSVILLEANTKPLLDHFIPVGWYLALDIKFTLILPFLVMLYAKKALWGYSVTIIGATLAMMNHIYFQYTHTRENPAVYSESAVLISELIGGQLTNGYSNFQYRCASFLVGVAAGFILNQYENREISRWPRGFVSKTKVMFAIYVYIAAFGMYILSLIPPYHESTLLVVGSIMLGTFHGLSALIIAPFLLLLITGYLPTLRRMLSSSFFRPFSNAMLSLVLIHFYIIIYRFSTQHIQDDLTSYSLFSRTVTMLIETYIGTSIVYVLFELPLRRSIIKLLFNSISLGEKIKKDQRISNEKKGSILHDSKKSGGHQDGRLD